MRDHYQNEQEIDAVVAGFEECTTGKDEFTHLSHLTVAVHYLRNLTSEQAFEKMRSGLFRFLDHHGVGRAKYNEQLTLSWITLIRSVIEKMDPNLSLLAVTNAVLERLGDSRIPIEGDHEARVGHTQPDSLRHRKQNRERFYERAVKRKISPKPPS